MGIKQPSAIQKVDAYKTPDGLIFSDHGEAAKHQATKELREFLVQVSTPGGADSEWADFIVANWSSFFGSLSLIHEANRPQATRSAS